MNDIMNLLTQQLSGGALQQLSQQVGADENKTQTAVAAAIPLLLAALSRNASQPAGAEALHGALQRDHDGSVLNNVMGFLNNSGAATSIGSGILKHVLGGQQGAVTNSLAQSTGLDTNAITNLLATVAPMVMGALGKTQQAQGLDASGLSHFLGNQVSNAQSTAPDLMGSLSKMLDSNNDGSVMDDLSNIAGSFFGGKK